MFLKEMVEQGVVTFEYVASLKMKADLITKVDANFTTLAKAVLLGKAVGDADADEEVPKAGATHDDAGAGASEPANNHAVNQALLGLCSKYRGNTMGDGPLQSKEATATETDVMVPDYAPGKPGCFD